MHFEFVRIQVKKFIRRHNFSCIKKNCGHYRFVRINSKPESAIVEGFERIVTAVARSFGIDNHMKTHIKSSFHFMKTLPATFFIFSIYEHTAGGINPTKYRDNGET